ncbi:MAG: DUF547 domain-containing protein [Chrysiogenetes bacterium]|nr:DUF547 domain-containing protein [Chrysiogenetes bacterium]
MIRAALCALFFLALTLTGARAARAQFDPSSLNRILRQYQHDGDFDYGAIRDKEKDNIAAILRSFGRVEKERWEGHVESEQKAFWMNAHLVITLWAIVANYPVEGDSIRFFPGDSVQQIPDFWDAQYITPEGMQSLRSIERKLIEQFGDVRAVLVLFNGTRSGPPPPTEAWTGRNVEKRIERRMEQYFASDRGAVHDYQNATLELSEAVTDFWRADVLAAARSARDANQGNVPVALRPRTGPTGPWRRYGEEDALLLEFLSPYLPARTLSRLKVKPHRIETLRYDWRLNDGTPPPPAPEGIPLDPAAPFQDLEPGELPAAQSEHKIRIPEKPKDPQELTPLFGE